MTRTLTVGRCHHRTITLAAILSICCAQALAAAPDADVVYVTDELRLGLYPTEETSGRALKTLVSGTELTILERSLMSIRIRSEEGDEGWVKTAYVVDKPPARRQLASLQALQEETAARLSAREENVATLAARIEELNTALARAEQGMADLPALREENAELRATLSAAGIRVPLLWLVLASLASLILGGLLGYWWLDRRVRKNFGGIRVY